MDASCRSRQGGRFGSPCQANQPSGSSGNEAAPTEPTIEGLMIQPVAKLRFVERYCPPSEGWSVFVDVDPSEEGRTGSPRKSVEAQARQARMVEQAPLAIQEMQELGAFVGNRSVQWRSHFQGSMELPRGDRDIVAVHPAKRLLWIVEVEGDSGGQPEGKIYKALGQLVCAVSEMIIPSFEHYYSLVAWGDGAARHLSRARASSHLGISGLIIAESPARDTWLFGSPPRVLSPRSSTATIAEPIGAAR